MISDKNYLMNLRWTIKPQPEKEKIQDLANSLNINEEIATLLVQRGIETHDQAYDFFVPKLEKLYDPFLMKDMDIAVERIEEAIKKDENILIYGDYDVDGTTSVALMSTYLSQFSDRISTYIPDRYQEGYGISYQGIDYAADNDFSLIIALDCGIKAIDKVAYAREKNIEFIICDHHLPGEKIPEAVAVLNPKRNDCDYPFKELCGCGVGFKLIQAFQERRNLSFELLLPYLDLVATAIGADIVPIVDENRILAYHGLKIINTDPRPGFRAIIEKTHKSDFSITDVVFIIAPRINAAGRMEHALSAVDLLTETNLVKAREFALKIETFNQDRRHSDKSITEEALIQIETSQEKERFTTVVYHQDWHKGVIGIVASRLTETYYRPTLVFTKSGDRLAASARSVSGFNIYEALEACAEHIEQFGGHKYAAGLTLHEENYEAFKQKFEEVVASSIDKKLLTKEIKIDMRLNIDRINSSFYNTIKRFAPFGPGNMRPVFLSENMIGQGAPRQIGPDKKHLKCRIKIDEKEDFLEAIGFGLGEKAEALISKSSFDAVYSLDQNEWNNKKIIQLKLRDLK